jgi:hypothetical protein
MCTPHILKLSRNSNTHFQLLKLLVLQTYAATAMANQTAPGPHSRPATRNENITRHGEVPECAISSKRQHIITGISGLVVEYIVAIDVTRVRFPADAFPENRTLCHCVSIHWQCATQQRSARTALCAAAALCAAYTQEVAPQISRSGGPLNERFPKTHYVAPARWLCGVGP